MNRGIFIVLVIIAVIAGAALYYVKEGPSVLAKAPLDQYIAFTSNRDGKKDVWVMKWDGSDLRNISSDAADDRLPSWSPDGKEILVVSDKANNTYQLYILSWDGKYKDQITTSTGSKDSPAWKKDGTRIAYVASGKVYTVKRRGGDEEQILPPHGTPDLSAFQGGASAYISASWSSDGNKMLCVQMANQDQIASVVDLADNEKPVTIITAQEVDVSWSPTGHKIAVAYIDYGGKHGLAIFDNDTLDLQELISSKGDTFGFLKPSWSPDGKTVVYEKWKISEGFPEKCVGIYGISADGGVPFVISNGDARQPKYSPDGKWIIYTLNSGNGNRDIMRCGADGRDHINLTKGIGDNYDPDWSPVITK